MPASIGGAGIGTGGALHFSGGSGAMSTVIWVAVVLKGLLRIGRLILRTRFGRQGLLRRNLITVFSTVNNLSQIIFASRAPFAGRACVRCIGNERRKRARTHAQQHARFLHASIGAACSDFSRWRCASTRRSRERVARARDHNVLSSMQAMRMRTTRCVCASHKPDCAKVRELFSRFADARSAARAFPRTGKRRTRDVSAAGSWSRDVGADQWSSSSSSSA